MHKHFLLFSLALTPVVALVSSCGSGASAVDSSTQSGSSGSGGGSGPADKCVVSAGVRTLLEETIGEDIYAAIGVATKTSDKERGFAIQIPGSKEGFVGVATVFSGCPNNNSVIKCASTEEMPPPSGPFWGDRDRCVQTRCEGGASNIALIDTYLTMKPNKKPNIKHEFTYETSLPSGTAIHNPNPLITWRVDLTDPSAIKTTGQVFSVVRITETDGTFINFSHEGSLSVERTDMDVSLATLDLTFTEILSGGEKLTASAMLDASGNASGEVKAGDRTIAQVKQDFILQWLEDCAPAH